MTTKFSGLILLLELYRNDILNCSQYDVSMKDKYGDKLDNEAGYQRYSPLHELTSAELNDRQALKRCLHDLMEDLDWI